MIGIVQEAPRGKDAKMFADIIRVKDGLDAGQLIAAIDTQRKKYGGLHQIVGVLEPLQVPLAEVRKHFKLPGTDPVTADLFRDKARMKNALRAAGLPCARHKLIHRWADAEAFVKEVGLPIVLKPPAGAGCKATWRIRSVEDLKSAIDTVNPSVDRPTLAEEFLRGQEYCYDTVTVGGKVLFENVSRYYPGPLEVTENPWIQWAVVLPKTIGPEFNDARKIGRATIAALGLKTGFTHMEWFRREDGSIAIGEIAARPPGANFVKMMSYAHDADMFRAWARAVIDDEFDGPLKRKFSVGCAYLRGIGHGRVVRVRGVAEANKRVGSVVVESKLPRIGAPKSDHYEGDGFVIVRHEDTEVVKKAITILIETIKVDYA